MKVLVTGANGQLGCEVRRVARERLQVCEFVFTDVAELDITDAAAVMDFVRQQGVDVIVNCAAYTNVDLAETEEERARLINATAVGYLAQAAREQGALLVHVSTDYVFGGGGNEPYVEGAPTCPLCAYGRTKLEGEMAIAASGCRYIILRTAWLYSVHGRNFVKTMLRLMRERESLQVVFDQVGSPTYAGDLADAIGQIIAAQPGDDQVGIFHFTNEGVCSWYDFAVAIGELAGMACRVRPCRSWEFSSQVRRPAFSVLDKAKIKRVFGMQIPHWRVSLEACVRRLLSSE